MSSFDLATCGNTVFSPCRKWRYFLRRPWAEQISQGFVDADLFDPSPVQAAAPIVFCLLNPSTADEVKDDPTVARCRRFAVRWGFGDVIVLNAFAYRATDPKDMKAQADPVGPDNDFYIRKTIEQVLALGGTCVCGWGNHGGHMTRSTALKALLADLPLQAFPLTKSGEPGHPLYLKSSIEPTSFAL